MRLPVKFDELEASFPIKFGEWYQVGEPETQTYLLITPEGEEIPAVLVDEKVVFDATANDIRLGKVAATGTGVTTGEKVIPSYHTTEAAKYIPVGCDFLIKLPVNSLYEYTKLQAIICPFNTSLSDSVSAEKVVINDDLYEVKSTVSIATVTVDQTSQTINLGITNTGDTPCVIRFFTYKEIY